MQQPDRKACINSLQRDAFFELGEEIQPLELEEPLEEDDILKVHGQEGPNGLLKCPNTRP